MDDRKMVKMQIGYLFYKIKERELRLLFHELFYYPSKKNVGWCPDTSKSINCK